MRKQFHLLHTNDLHSHFEQMPKIDSMVSRLTKNWRSLNQPYLLVDIGDHMDRSRLETEATDGQANKEILEATGYHLITFGNNELLTFTKEQLKNNYSNASFKVISTNVVERTTGKHPSWVRPRIKLHMNHISLGILAVTIPYPNVYEEMGWKVIEPIDVLKQEVKRLACEVDIVLLFSHLGLPFDRKIAREVPGIDVIFGAHTHHLLEIPEKIDQTLLVAAGKFGYHLGHVLFDVEDEQKKKIHIKGKCYSVADVDDENKINQIITRFSKLADHNLSQPIAILNEPLIIDRQGESPFGNLLADSLRDWIVTDIALVNSGQILDHLHKGIITKRDLHQVCPHPINPALLVMKGNTIRNTLERSLLESYREKRIKGLGFRGELLGSICVSGLKISYDPSNEPYKKILSVYVGQQPLYDEKEYRVATIDMLTFGVDYLDLKDSRIVKYYLPEFLRDLLAHYLGKSQSLKICQSDRWIRMNTSISKRTKEENG